MVLVWVRWMRWEDLREVTCARISLCFLNTSLRLLRTDFRGSIRETAKCVLEYALEIVEGLCAPVERCALARRRLAHESNEGIARHDSRRSDRRKLGITEEKVVEQQVSRSVALDFVGCLSIKCGSNKLKPVTSLLHKLA